MGENFLIDLVGTLQQSKSKKRVNDDIKTLEKTINALRLTATFAKADTKKELNAYIKQLSNQLSTIKLKAQIDSKNLKSEVDKALTNVSFKEIDALNIDENKTKLKIKKVIADAKEFVEKNPLSVGINIESKKNKLDNDLTTYLNKNTKINESKVLLGEADKVRDLIGLITDKKSLREATDAFQLYKSSVASIGYNTKSTTDKIKDMLGHVTKLGSIFSVGTLAVNSFTKSLKTLQSIDDILTEISKTSNLTAQELEKLGDISFKSASKYGKTASDYLTGIQEMSRSGFYGEKGSAMAEQSLLAQAAGDISAEIANNYILATNAAYKFNGEAEKLNAVLDGQNSITNRNSVAMSDMATAMSEAGTVASSYRVSVEDLSAMIGTMESVTKLGGSEVGNGIKAILINLQNATSSKITDTLNAANASMTEFVNGTEKLRDPISILRDLAETFNQLDEDDALRAEILTNIGGKHQASKLAALLQNMELFDKMLVDYSEGSGSAMEEAMKSANNLSGKLNQIQNSWDSLVASITNKNAVLNGLTFGDKLIQGAESFIDTFGTIPTILTAINSSMVAMKKDYGITQIINPETKKLDVQGNIFGIVDFTAIKNQKKHFEEAGNAISGWNSKLNQGLTDINKFENTLVSNNAQLKEYLSTCSKDAPASLNGYKQYLQQTGQATEDLRLKTILLNTALTFLGSIAVQAVITGIVQAFDKFNETVVESKEKIDDINSKISDLKSQIEELNNLEYKSEFDNQKISQLEKELELQQRILEIEQKRLYQNQIGIKFSDYFDKDSLATKQNAEYDRNNKEGFSNLSRAFKTYESSLNDIDSELASLQEKLNSENLIGHDRFMTEGKIAKLTEKRNDLLEKQQIIEDQLTLNMGEYLKNYQTAQEAIESGLLTGSDLEKAESMAEYWDSLYKDSLGIVTNIQKMGGRYDNTNDLLEEKFSNISRDDLVSLSDDDKRIALSFDPDNIIGFEELKQRIEETKDNIEELNDTPVTFNISDTITKLDELKDKFNVLDQTYAKLFDADTEIGFEDLSSINEAFKDLDGIDSFIQRLQEAGQDTEAVTEVMQDLIAAYLDYSGVLNNVTEENSALIEQFLTEMGIENAHEIVLAQLSVQTETLALQKQFLTEKGYELIDATLEEIVQFLNEADASDEAKASIAQLALAKLEANNTVIDTSADIENIIALANAAGASAAAIAKFKNAMAVIENAKSQPVNGVGGLKQLDYAQSLKDSVENSTYDWEFQKLDARDFKVSTSPKYTPKYSGGSSTKKAINDTAKDAKKSAEKAAKEIENQFEQTVDFFERRSDVLNDTLSLLKTNLDNVTGAFAKNKLVDAQLGVTEEKFKNYSDALNMYTQKANEALSKLPSDIAAKIKDGAVDLTTFIGDGNKDVVDAIKDYEQWADKVADCKQELAELRTAIRQLELDKFNNIMDDFKNQFDLHEDGKDLISKQIDLLKEAGQLIGESFFTSQIDQSKKQLELLEAEKAQLVGQMNSAIGSGRVQKGTDEWLEMVNALSDVEGNILDCKKAIEEFDNELLQLHWDVFDRIQGQFKDLDSELSNLKGLFEDSKVTDVNFNWSKEALAQLGLLTQQYELAQYQVQQYNDEINQLSKDYLAGRYSATEYADKLADLSSAQWDAVNSSESIKDAIMDLNEVRIDEEITAIEKEIDAYKELIDAQIDALKSAKDLHDYQERIAEKTKAVTDLERQIAAMANDDSATSIAKRKQLEEQLAQARKDLENEQYDHSIEAQEDALNKQYDQYEEERNAEIEALKASLEEKETLIAESFEAVKQNADIVGQEIARIATEHGITVSNAIITSWQNDEMAVASYGAVLSEQTSAFIGNIMGVEYEVYNLQAQADETANTLAWMFSTRADTLVGELTASYYSEQNLNYMTQALRDSLVRTLEGGYNISGITSALNGIASGLNGVASAANNAASAISAVGAAQASVNSGNSSGNSSGYKYYNTNTTKLPETVKGGIKTHTPQYIHYASGTRNAKGGLRVVNEEGAELELPKLPSGNYAIGNEGDQILTKEQTDNVQKWSKLTPEEFAAKHGVDYSAIKRLVNAPLYDVGHMARVPETVPEHTNRTNNVNVHYDSLVQINGDVHDANRIVKQMENVAEKAIKKSWHDFNMTLKYGY